MVNGTFIFIWISAVTPNDEFSPPLAKIQRARRNYVGFGGIYLIFPKLSKDHL